MVVRSRGEPLDLAAHLVAKLRSRFDSGCRREEFGVPDDGAAMETDLRWPPELCADSGRADWMSSIARRRRDARFDFMVAEFPRLEPEAMLFSRLCG